MLVIFGKYVYVGRGVEGGRERNLRARDMCGIDS